MHVDFSSLFNNGETVAVALSGGGDSMALLNVLLEHAKALGITVIALNVEHGIRGQSSIDDSAFVKDYCAQKNVKLLSYSVDSLKRAKDKKLTVEQSARELRYECFYDAINSGKCDKVATAHHLSDLTESVLLNLFRGTGIKGLIGIQENYHDKIVRPLLAVSKADIEEYLDQNNIPYVTDQTNLSDEYTRNNLRLNIIPKIQKIFPDFEKSILRLTKIAKCDDEYLEQESEKILSLTPNSAEIALPTHRALFTRATIKAVKHLGIEKDWEKTHLDSTFNLTNNQTGSMVNLPKNVIAIKEYDKIVFYKDKKANVKELPFFIGQSAFNEHQLIIEEKSPLNLNLKDGLYADGNKIPKTAVIRTKKDGDTFTKFGGGTKSLSDFFTDKKIPLKDRQNIPLLCDNNNVLVVFGIALSNNVKVDEKTKNVIKFDIR